MILITRISASNPQQSHIKHRPCGWWVGHIQFSDITLDEIHRSRVVSAQTALGFSLDLRKTFPITHSTGC